MAKINWKGEPPRAKWEKVVQTADGGRAGIRWALRADGKLLSQRGHTYIQGNSFHMEWDEWKISVLSRKGETHTVGGIEARLGSALKAGVIRRIL